VFSVKVSSWNLKVAVKRGTSLKWYIFVFRNLRKKDLCSSKIHVRLSSLLRYYLWDFFKKCLEPHPILLCRLTDQRWLQLARETETTLSSFLSFWHWACGPLHSIFLQPQPVGCHYGMWGLRKTLATFQLSKCLKGSKFVHQKMQPDNAIKNMAFLGNRYNKLCPWTHLKTVCRLQYVTWTRLRVTLCPLCHKT